MEIAVLTARLEADVADLLRKTATADAAIAAYSAQTKKAVRDTEALSAAQKDVGLSATAIAATLAGLRAMDVETNKLKRDTLEAAAAQKELGAAAYNWNNLIAATRLFAEQHRMHGDPLRTSGGAIPLTSGGFSNTVGGMGEYQRFRAQLDAVQRTATGALIMAQGGAPNRMIGSFGDGSLGGGVFGGRSGLTGGGSDRTRDGLMGMLFGARGAREGERFGSALERETARLFGGGHGDTGFAGRGLLGGLLPGGRQASAAAVTTAIGTILAMGPAAGPAAAGLGLGATAGAGALVGGAGVLALAFHGITAEAFKTKEAFEKLTPQQQRFVQTLRSLDAGIGSMLTGLAQRTVLPGLTSGLRSAFTPSSVSALTGGVSAFGGAISGGAQQAGQMFGSPQFARAFGDVLQADARYLRDMIDGVVHLTSAFVHLQQAAIPLTDWMDKGILRLTARIDALVQHSQRTGGLAQFFDRSKIALQAFGALLGSVGHLFGAVFNVVGFQNSIGLIRTLARALNVVTGILNDNRDVLRHFFAGALAAANQVLSLVNRLRGPLRTILILLDNLIGGTDGWKRAIDTLAILAIGRFALMKLGIIGVGTAAVTTSGEVSAIGDAAIAAQSKFAGLLKVLGVVAAVDIIGNAKTDANRPSHGFGSWSGSGGWGKFFNDIAGTVGLDWKGGASGGTAPGINVPSLFAAVSRGEVGVAGIQQLQSMLSRADYTALLAHARASSPNAPLTGRAAGTSGGGMAGSIFGTPPALAVKAGDLLPQAMQLAIARASTTPSLSDDKTSAAAAIGYLQAHMGKLTPEQRVDAFNQIASLQSIIKGAVPPPVAIKTGLDILSFGRASSLQAAQARVAEFSGAGGAAGTFTPGRLRAERALVAQLEGAQKDLNRQLHQGSVSQDQARAIERERVVLARALAAAHKAVAADVIAQRLSPLQGRVARAQEAIANLGGITSTTDFSPQTLHAALALVAALEKYRDGLKGIVGLDKERHRVALQIAAAEKDVAEQQKAQRTQATQTMIGRLLHAGGGIPGLTSINTSVRRLNENIAHRREQGEIIPKAVLDIRDHIAAAIKYAAAHGGTVSTQNRQIIAGLLAKANDYLKQIAVSNMPMSVRRATPAEILAREGLGGLHGEARRKALAGLSEVVAGHGNIHTGQSAFGIGLAGRAQVIHINGDIHVSTQAKDPAEVARALRREFQQTNRRNTVQTRGPNAGRPIGP